LSLLLPYVLYPYSDFRVFFLTQEKKSGGWPGVCFSNPHTDEEGRWITATVHTPHFPPMRMCGVYAPNSSHHEFIKKILRVAANCELILGDFNFTMRYGDRSPPSPLDSEVITCLNALSTVGYTDLAPTGSLHNFTHRNR